MKRIVSALILVVAFALPAQAEVNGIYFGAKFIDAIQSTGPVTRNFTAFPGLADFSQNTIGGGIFVGYDFYPKFQIPVRAEVEYALRTQIENEQSAGRATPWGDIHNKIKYNANIQTLFANVYYDFHNSTAFTPYVGGGLGMGFVRSNFERNEYNNGVLQNSQSVDAYSTVFAWNIGVGCAYSFTENFAIDLAYRFVGYGPTEISYPDQQGPGGPIETHAYNTLPNAHEFSLGVRFTF